MTTDRGFFLTLGAWRLPWVLRVQTPWTASSSTSLSFLLSFLCSVFFARVCFLRLWPGSVLLSRFGVRTCLRRSEPVFFAVNKQRTYHKLNAASETMQDYALCLHGSWSAHRGQFAVGILAKSTHEKQTAKLPPVDGYARMLAYDTFFGMSSLAFSVFL